MTDTFTPLPLQIRREMSNTLSQWRPCTMSVSLDVQEREEAYSIGFRPRYGSEEQVPTLVGSFHEDWMVPQSWSLCCHQRVQGLASSSIMSLQWPECKKSLSLFVGSSIGFLLRVSGKIVTSGQDRLGERAIVVRDNGPNGMWVWWESWVCSFVGRIGIIVIMLNNCDVQSNCLLLWSQTYPRSPLFLIIRLWFR